MAAIPGIRFDITGASGSQGLLTPKSGWRAYVLNRGGYVSQSSSGTTLTFDSAAIAGRFGVGIWVQAGLLTSQIRQVAAVGGNSLTLSGAAVTVSENDRIYIIGSTEPTISGGSVTYSTPSTTIVQRDDDGSDRYTNSMVTSTSDGLIQFFSVPAVYDCLIQDGNQTLQGSLIDVPVGVAEGVSTSQASVFGATVTVNAAFGVTGWATFGQTVTMNANAGVTGTFTVGATFTAHANSGITGSLTVGATLTVTGAASIGGTASITGNVTIGGTETINGALGVTGTITGVSANFSGYVDALRFAAIRGSTLQLTDYSLDSGWGTTASINSANTSDKSRDVRGFVSVMAGGTGITDNPILYVNFNGGAWAGNINFTLASRMDIASPTTAWWRPLPSGTTQFRFQFVGLPVSGNIYTLGWFAIG